MVNASQKKYFKSVFKILSFVLLSSLVFNCCAPHKDQLQNLPRFSEAEAVWNHFQRAQDNYLEQVKSVSIQGSLQYSNYQENNRVKIHLWGDLSGPFRINLQAGFGHIFALWRVDNHQTKAFYPDENKVFISKDPQQTILYSLDIHLPFPFQKTPSLLSGALINIIPKNYQKVSKIPDKGWQFQFSDDQLIKNLLMDAQGRILLLKGNKPFSWQIKFEDFIFVRDHFLGQKITIINEFNEKFVFHLQKIKNREKIWPKESLQLQLPNDIEFFYF